MIDSKVANGRATQEPLLLDSKMLAGLLSVSVATIGRMDDAGKLPEPIRLSGGCKRWSRAVIEAWIAARCPDRATFEAGNASA